MLITCFSFFENLEYMYRVSRARGYYDYKKKLNQVNKKIIIQMQ